MKITIVGAGNLGTALATVLSKKNDVVFYSIEDDVNDQINSLHENKKYMPGVELDHRISAVNDPSIMQFSDIILLCVPSSVIKIVCRAIKPFIKDQIVISTSKGLSNDFKVMTQVINDELGINSFAISGPSIAEDIAHGKLTKVALGGDQETCEKVKPFLESDTFLVTTTSDVVGIQLVGFYKNIITIGVAICDGLELGDNFKAAFLSKTYRNLYHLNKERVHAHTFLDVAGIGDLFVTSLSPNSRNHRFGEMIGQGFTVDDAKSKIGQVVEGYDNLVRILKEKRVDFLDYDLFESIEFCTKSDTLKEEKINRLVNYVKN